VFDNATGAYFYLAGAQLKKSAVAIGSDHLVVAHVHISPCNTSDAATHFKQDMTNNATLLSDELWASPAPSANPAVQPAAPWSGWGSLPQVSLAGRPDVKAIILHEYPGLNASEAAPKRTCCDLVLVDESATTAAGTTAAGTTGATDAATTGTGTGTGTAAGTTATPAVNCTAAEDDKDQPCQACFKLTGCQYVSAVETDFFTLGGSCILATAVVPTGKKMVPDNKSCADYCGTRECKTCIDSPMQECVWCDTVQATVGLKGKGSCERTKCTLGSKPITDKTKCGSAASVVLSVVGAVIAMLAML